MTKFSISFGNMPTDGRDPNPNRERSPESSEALGRYARAIDTIKTYAKENGLELVVVDGNDKSVYMCMKRIGNFAYGFEETIHLRPKKKKGKKRIKIAEDGSSVPGEVDDSDVIEVRGDLEAYYYADYSTYGYASLIVIDVDDSLVKRVKEAWDTNKNPPTAVQRKALRAKWGSGQRCYGHCKR